MRILFLNGHIRWNNVSKLKINDVLDQAWFPENPFVAIVDMPLIV